MRAGKLRHRVAIVRETVTTDAFGQDQVTGETTVATQWGEVRPLTGKELEIARQLRAETTHRITFRRVVDILPTDHLVFKGRRFNVLEIIDLEERGITYSVLASENMTGGEAG